jgi:putative DNA primase/helicase
MTYRERPDVFVEFNQRTSLETVVEWHESHGHKVTSRVADRVEFMREGKDGSGQSFNVKICNRVPITYTFSTYAGIPLRELSPSQLRCFYETGSCDTAAMASFAEKLREELGWNKNDNNRDGDDGEKATSTEPLFIPRPWNDPVRLAEAFLKENIVMFVKKTGFWYDDGHYAITENETIDDRSWKLAEREAVTEYEKRLAEYESGKSEEDEEPSAPQVSIAIVNNMVRAIRSATRYPDSTLPGVWLADPEFDGTPLCVAKGVLNLWTRELYSHTPWLFTLTKLPVVYDPAAPKPVKFLKLLNELSCHDPDWIMVLQEVFGACLDTSLPWKYLAAFVGYGDNGKTVVLNILRSLLGAGNHSAQSLSQLTCSQFGTFPLFGKLANIVGDESSFDSVKEGRLKELTGGEKGVAYEQKNKTPFFGPNTCKLVFGCNKIPQFNDDTEGVWNRLIIMAFEFAVPADQKNPAMLEDEFWKDELPGILNWALDGLTRVREKGHITQSERLQAAVQRHRIVSDPARHFLLDYYIEATTEENEIYVISKDMYERYRGWLKAHGFDEKKYLKPEPHFGRLVSNVFKNSKSSVQRTGSKTERVRLDLRLLTDEERFERGRYGYE